MEQEFVILQNEFGKCKAHGRSNNASTNMPKVFISVCFDQENKLQLISFERSKRVIYVKVIKIFASQLYAYVLNVGTILCADIIFTLFVERTHICNYFRISNSSKIVILQFRLNSSTLLLDTF